MLVSQGFGRDALPPGSVPQVVLLGGKSFVTPRRCAVAGIHPAETCLAPIADVREGHFASRRRVCAASVDPSQSSPRTVAREPSAY